MQKKNHLQLSLILLFFFIVTLILYFPTFSFNFVNFDDDIHIFENPYLSPPTVSNLLNFWFAPYQFLYIPLTYNVWGILSFISECCTKFEGAGNTNPFVFHFANFCLHFINGIIVLSILRLIVNITSLRINSFAIQSSIKKNLAISAGALLFILHPVQVESVAWATGMRDLTGAFFSFLALRQFLVYTINVYSLKFPETYFAEEDKISEKKKSTLTGVAAFICFFMALLAKPSSVSMPVVTGFLVTSILDKSFKKIATPLIFWMMAAVGCIWWTKFAQPLNLSFIPPFWSRVAIALDTVGFYVTKLIAPFSLTMDYGRSPLYVLNLGWENINLVLGSITVIVFAWTMLRKKIWRVPIALFLIFILPVAGLLPFNFQAYSTVSDRYLYMSILGASVGMTFWILVSAWRNISIYFCYFLLFFFSIISSYQVKHWRNSTTLFEHAVNANGNGYLARIGFGLELSEQNKMKEAIEQNQLAIKINPDFIQAYFNLGNIYAKQKNSAKAIEYYKKALRLKFDFEEGYINLGVSLRDEDKLDEAVEIYKRGLQFNEKSIKLRNHLAFAFTRQNKLAQATESYYEIVKIVPDSFQAHNNLGIAYAREKKFEKAEESFTKALSIDPNNEDAKYNLKITKEQK